MSLTDVAAPIASLENIEVLVVEDSPTQALLLEESLLKNHLKVKIARDGQEAFEMLPSYRPKVIICDIEMPRMNGYEFCRKIRSDSNYNHIPVILLTNLNDPMDVIRAIDCRADSFLTKPCEVNFILSTISDVITNKEQSKSSTSQDKLTFYFHGESHLIKVDPAQITTLLLSTYSNAIQKNLELEQAYHKMHEVNQELKESNEQLKKLNEQKNQFLGMAAHDLRNPLSAIVSFTGLLISMLKDKADENSKTMLQGIKTSSSFMLSLINDFLDISVIDSGTVSLRISEVDLGKLIEDSLTTLRTLAANKNIQLNFKNSADNRKIKLDINKVHQIINNIVTNSIKFSHTGSVINISLETNEKEAIIKFQDHGIGFSSEIKESIFQPFTKGHNAGTSGEKGTGLGLAIVQKIVAVHNGTIRVESEPGKGTTFIVSFPF